MGPYAFNMFKRHPPKHEVRRRIKFWFPVFIWMGLIFFSSSIHQENIAVLFSFQDVVFHTLAYLILAVFFARALKNTNSNIAALQILIFTIVFGVAYGLSDEFHQSFVPGRSVSGFDVFMDGAGSVFGGLLHRWLR